jgi:hypothetical protein
MKAGGGPQYNDGEFGNGLSQYNTGGNANDFDSMSGSKGGGGVRVEGGRPKVEGGRPRAG